MIFRSLVGREVEEFGARIGSNLLEASDRFGERDFWAVYASEPWLPSESPPDDPEFPFESAYAALYLRNYREGPPAYRNESGEIFYRDTAFSTNLTGMYDPPEPIETPGIGFREFIAISEKVRSAHFSGLGLERVREILEESVSLYGSEWFSEI